MEKVKAAFHRAGQSRGEYALRMQLLLLIRSYLLIVWQKAHSKLDHQPSEGSGSYQGKDNTFLRIWLVWAGWAF